MEEATRARPMPGRPSEAPEPVPGEVTVVCHPIGHVENQCDQPARPEVLRASQSRIVVYPEFSEGLEGLEQSNRLTVVFHFHRAEGYALRQHPRGDQTRPLRGVFSLCSPFRPNRIGVSFPRLLQREGNVLHVTELDALNESPVLDIKPFVAPE